MKKSILPFLLAAGSVLMSGCAEKQTPVSSVEIIPTITRVTGLHFDTGDRIGLTITKESGTYVENHMMTYAGSTFTASGLLWYNDLNEKSTLTAYYPYAAAGVPAEFSVALDQTGGCSSSDLLGAVKKEVTPASAPVSMLFYHLMSELTIVVTNNSDAAVTDLTVGGLAPTATVDLTVPTAAVKTGAAAAEIKAFEVTPDATYRVVLVPQQAALSVTVATRDGKSRSKTIDEALLESGKRYDMSVVVTNIDIELSLSGDINDWGDGGSLDGGGDQGGNQGGNDDVQGTGQVTYEGETYRTAVIDGREWMSENLRYMPAGATLENGVWYPANGESEVAEKGLLYNYATASGGAANRSGGALRGICPEGWHLPALEELQSLVASAQRPDGFFCCAGFWRENGASTNNGYGSSEKGYLMGAGTLVNERCNCVNYSTTDLPQVASVPVEYGISVRCVKDDAVR